MSSNLTLAELSKETRLDWQAYLQPLNMSGIQKVFLWGGRNTWIKALEAIGTYDRTSMSYIALWRLAAAHFSKLGKPYYNLWGEIRFFFRFSPCDMY
jgi:hypothetical protein